MYGAALAAAPVVGQAYVAETTIGQTQRVRGTAGIGAVSGLALVPPPADCSAPPQACSFPSTSQRQLPRALRSSSR